MMVAEGQRSHACAAAPQQQRRALFCSAAVLLLSLCVLVGRERGLVVCETGLFKGECVRESRN
jgi:hypothetical protein